MTLECCGHDGTYAMKVETFEASARIGQKAFESLKASEAKVWATECPLAATQFEQHAGQQGPAPDDHPGAGVPRRWLPHQAAPQEGVRPCAWFDVTRSWTT
jgi:Fe-S oxidoreductase